ncbi:hypothetical protein PMAYCL1PPCAC_26266, partial [Pristionchus mayeri]
ELLLEISSLVRSIEIKQIPNYAHTNLDWPQIILGMFANKLDTLRLDNTHYPQYITRTGVEILKEVNFKLPKLDKPIWFSASCDTTVEEISDYDN